MTITEIQPDDTGDIRRAVGEKTVIIPIIPRRPSGSGVSYTERRAFAYVGSTDELPIIIDVADRRPANEQQAEEPEATGTPRHRARHRLTLLGRLRRWTGGTR